MSAKLFTTLFEHKAWANQELLAQLIAHQSVENAKSWRLATRLMNHLYVVDRIFIGHLTGIAHGYPATNTPETPELADLLRNTSETDRELINFIAQCPKARFDEVIDFVFTDGKAGRMSVAEILMHLITHASYHRGQIGRVIAEAKVKIPADILTGFLHRNREDQSAS
ncbi:DinB family protein [Chitinibacter bivalviorum]|uniref:DinB family protein n=1 Tax=Chitinibacter bivalviorum TaxID=2739434 RepID=A0A7H9BFM6_9NEIS|nr:DinB family protein [Chitinibacter bivalviorum]QLG87387.1 DinB family protein [Chitinibacter bivalviorum]